MGDVRVTQQYASLAILRKAAAVTDAATGVTACSATLNGECETLNDPWPTSLGGSIEELDVWFDYGTDPNFDTYDSTTTETITEPQAFDAEVTGLTFTEIYYFRACATDGETTWYGGVESFVAADYHYSENDETDFETGTLSNVEVVNDCLEIEKFSAASTKEPDEISGLLLWYKADSISGLYDNDKVSQWDDQSGNDNHATQGTSDYQPIYKTSILNGKPVVRFDGSNDFMSFTSALTNVRTAIFVLKSETPVPDRGVVLGGASHYDWHDNDSYMLSGSYAATGLKNGDAYVNGVETAPLDVLKPTEFTIISFVTSANVRADRITRDRNYSSRVWHGDYAEIILYSSALSKSDLADVEEYLGQKYDIADYLQYRSSGNRVTAEIDISSLSNYSGSLVTWDVENPTDTTFSIQSRVSDDNGATWTDWANVDLDGGIPEIGDIPDFSQAKLQFKQLFSTSDPTQTPSLSEFEVFIQTTACAAVTTLAATNVFSTTARLNGELLSMVDEASVDVYFSWREKDSGDSWATTTPQTLTEIGTYYEDLGELESGVTYEFRAVMEYGDSGIGYGGILEFQTIVGGRPFVILF